MFAAFCFALPVQLSFPVFLEQVAPQRGALEDGLYQVVRLEWLGQVLIHLSLDALLSVPHHRVCRQGDDWRSVVQILLVLPNLAGCLESTLLHNNG